MERKIGKTFEYKGKKLQVKEVSDGTCNGCFFEGRYKWATEDIVGFCDPLFRRDKKEVIFVEVTEQTEQPQKLNLCEILKHCPRGTRLYSTTFGYVNFKMLIPSSEYPIIVYCKDEINEKSFTVDGKFMKNYDAECTLFPSKDQRDWSKFNPQSK